MAKATKFERLVRKADDAGKIRRYSVNPDVVALRVERVMTGSTVLFWGGLLAGLGFTVPNVASFMGYGFGWLVSPAINAPLIALLVAGSIMARYDEKPSRGVQFGKFLLLGFEYGMNTWTAWAAQNPADIFKHSVPMIIVVLCAESITDLRAALTRCVEKAYTLAAQVSADVQAVAEKIDEEPADAEPEPELSAGDVMKGSAALNPEIEPVVEPEPEIIPEPEHYRPAGGKRAVQLAEDMAKLEGEYGDGVAFLMMPEAERVKAIKILFECGNSRAYRLAEKFGEIVEAKMRSDVS